MDTRREFPGRKNRNQERSSMSCMKVYPEELVASVRFYDGDVKPNETIEMYLLKEAFEELERHAEICGDPNLYDFATEFMLETVKRAIFMKIPTDRKVAWLKNRYISNMLVASS
ncbi:hypothetical protein KSP40_PGU004578 [Platanthera guangdongensis]|uniref:Uncharacterized protein n=1 Tax=Platanthera guangdongensis TaxID=2320717 RepID=A0ABR2MYA1_9ASPA